MTRAALIGHTGFVGGNLTADARYTHRYNSKNIDEIRDESFDLLVSAGAPAVKWKANKEPEADRAALARLMEPLATVRAAEVVLISTVDVYPRPVGVDERDVIAPEDCPQAYGRHRLELEAFFRERFGRVLIVRLPGLYGEGLKKNVIYDLLNDNMVEAITTNARFQFYGLDRLGADIDRAREAGLDLVNFATEPVLVDDIVRGVFGVELPGQEGENPPLYDFRTIHAEALGGAGGYLQDGRTVLEGIRRYVDSRRSADR